MKDYYKILRLNTTASSEEIKRSYRRLAMVYHPDRSQSTDSHELFSEINEAYEILSDPNLKIQYDNLLSNSQGDYFVEAQAFEQYYNTTKTTNRSQRVYRATRKTKDIVTPYIVKVYRLSAYLSLAFMTLLIIDFLLPGIRSEEELIEKKFGNGNTMEYVLKTKKNVIVVDQDDYVNFRVGDKFTYTRSTVFDFDLSLDMVVDRENKTYELPGNFFKFFNLFIIIVFVFAILTIKAKKEQDVLQFGTANFYLTLIILVTVLAAY